MIYTDKNAINLSCIFPHDVFLLPVIWLLPLPLFVLSCFCSSHLFYCLCEQLLNVTDDSGSRSVLDAFFLGKALAEALNERVESAVGELLSTIGRLQSEQQKQVLDFQVQTYWVTVFFQWFCFHLLYFFLLSYTFNRVLFLWKISLKVVFFLLNSGVWNACYMSACVSCVVYLEKRCNLCIPLNIIDVYTMVTTSISRIFEYIMYSYSSKLECGQLKLVYFLENYM